jgi:glycosyltransferase involved in cell wall biosynthesis
MIHFWIGAVPSLRLPGQRVIEMVANADRQRVLMLCAHEPTMDPRVKWSAMSAAKSFDVTVLGFNNAASSLPDDETKDGYRIVRRLHSFVSLLTYPRCFCAAVSPASWALAVVLALVLTPLIAIATGLSIMVMAMIAIKRGRSLAKSWYATLLPGPVGPYLRRVVTAVKRLPGRRVVAAVKWPRGGGPAAQEDEEQKRRRSLASLYARLHYIVNLMRMQFGPPAQWFTDYIDALPDKPHVVHCNDLDTLLVGVVAKRRHGCRVVYDAHEYYPQTDPYGRWLDIWLFSAIEWMLLRRCDAAVTVNAPMAEQISKAYGYHPIYAVPNAEPRADELVVPMRTAMTTLADGRLKCLVQGRFSPRRGMEEVIEDWAHVDPQKAALFLRGPANIYSQQGEELASRLGLLDRSVYFLPAVTEDELVAAAAEADIGIIPYLSDFVIYEYACPNKLAQYMHGGLAILSNDLAYVRSVIEWGNAGLVYRVKDKGSLAKAVHRLADEPELLKRLKGSATEFARDKFNWQAYSPIFDALYRGEKPDLAPDGTVRVTA